MCRDSDGRSQEVQLAGEMIGEVARLEVEMCEAELRVAHGTGRVEEVVEPVDVEDVARRVL